MEIKESLLIIRDNLTSKMQSIAIAESVTAGLLQSVIASCEEASRFFQGGITVYNIGQKCRHLQIDPIHGMDCNCVSEKIANDMSVNVCKLFSSNWGIAVTGYATPVPESDNKLFAYFAISLNGQVLELQKIEAESDQPQNVQMFYIEQIIKSLLTLSYQNDKTKNFNPTPMFV